MRAFSMPAYALLITEGGQLFVDATFDTGVSRSVGPFMSAEEAMTHIETQQAEDREKALAAFAREFS